MVGLFLFYFPPLKSFFIGFALLFDMAFIAGIANGMWFLFISPIGLAVLAVNFIV